MTPAVTLAVSLGTLTARHGEPVGAVYLLMPLLVVDAILAPMLIVRAALSNGLSYRQKILAIVIGASVIPMFFLVSGVLWLLGPHNRHGTVAGAAVSLLLVLVWTGLLVAVRAAGHVREGEV